MNAKTASCVLFALMLALGLCACSDDSDPPTPDGGDTGVDAGSDAGVDAAPASLVIPGLSAPVEAVYDEHGVLHLTCKTDKDCMAALGYFHAANRFFTMDVARHLMRGRLAEMVKLGDAVLKGDYTLRHLTTNAAGEPVEELSLTKMSAESVKLLDRYTIGVNAWIEDMQHGRNGAKLPTEYNPPMIVKDVQPWENADTMAVALYMMDDLGNSAAVELDAADIAASADPDLAADLLSLRPAFQVFTSSSAGLTKIGYQPWKLDFSRFVEARSVLRQARDRLRATIAPLSGKAGASNNWALAPSRTSAGKALLANDPHLGINNPAIFMLVELDAKSSGSGTIHVAGGTIPGIPVVLIGRNEQLAWGLTVANYDLNEVYIEKLNAAGTAVIFNGKEVPLVEKKFTFGNAAGQPVEKTLQYVPHHGPVLAIDTAAGTAVSMRWVVHEGISDLDAFFAMMTAQSVSEVPAALQSLTATNQNWVVVDTKGKIGWFPYAKIPSRPWASMALPPWLPVPGDGSAEWSNGFVKMSDLPQAENPPNGFVATANQGHTPATADGDPTNNAGYVGFQEWGTAVGCRMSRIVSMIEDKKNAHDVDSMLAIQKDTHSLLGETLTPVLLAATAGATLSPEATKVVTALTAWKHTCPTGLASTDPNGKNDSDAARVQESVGCTAFHVALFKLLAAAFEDEAQKAGVGFPIRAKLNVMLTSILDPGQIKSTFWDDVSTTSTVETRDDIMLRAVVDAGQALVAWKPSEADWQWGRTHTLTQRSIFDSFGLAIFNDGPYANDGGLWTVDVGDPKPKPDIDMSHTNGPALRMVVEASASGLTMNFQLPGGTSMDRDSPRYNQLLDRYLRNEPFDFPFGPGAVKTPAETLTVSPD